jgi:antitoxin component YwqK of YwqJK toxin-antitoxin module
MSCTVIQKTKKSEEINCLAIDNDKGNYIFKDFPKREKDFSECDIESDFVDGCKRYGKISDKGFKEGMFRSPHCGYTDNWKNPFKIEYFKDGLRDSIFKIVDENNKIIYETTFKMGTGLWKEFHGNGKIYFETYTKDGYFTDTLRLHNKEGEIYEKRLYQKDALVYYIGNDNWCLKFRHYPNDSTYLEVDSYEEKNLKQGAFRNTFRYKTKEEFDNDYFAKNTLKR